MWYIFRMPSVAQVIAELSFDQRLRKMQYVLVPVWSWNCDPQLKKIENMVRAVLWMIAVSTASKCQYVSDFDKTIAKRLLRRLAIVWLPFCQNSISFRMVCKVYQNIKLNHHTFYEALQLKILSKRIDALYTWVLYRYVLTLLSAVENSRNS